MHLYKVYSQGAALQDAVLQVAETLIISDFRIKNWSFFNFGGNQDFLGDKSAGAPRTGGSVHFPKVPYGKSGSVYSY